MTDFDRDTYEKVKRERDPKNTEPSTWFVTYSVCTPAERDPRDKRLERRSQ